MLFRVDVFLPVSHFGEEKRTGNSGPDDKTQNYDKKWKKSKSCGLFGYKKMGERAKIVIFACIEL